MAEGRTPIYGLDLVRLTAALCVTTYHLAFKQIALSGTIVSTVTPTGYLPGWWAVTWWGWIGVQIFFVISGTVIAYSMAGASPGLFFRKRVERLYPALLICTTLALPVAIAVFGTPPAKAVRLYLSTNLFHPSGPWLLGQFWTLPMEAIFYGFMWLVILAGAQARLRQIAWGMACVSALFWLTRSAGVDPLNGRLSCLLLFQHGGYFALGIHLAQRVPDARPLSRHLLPLVTIITAAMQIKATAAGEMLGHGLADSWIMPFLVWLLAVGAIAASIRFRVRIAAAVAARNDALRLLGLATYPLYLVHMHVGVPVLLGLLLAGLLTPLAIAVAIAASLAAALGIARYLEPPVHRMVSLLLQGRLVQRPRLA